jgi:hypothetical protein
MIRNAFYCIYNDKEYRVGKKTKDTINIISNDEKSIQNGFKQHEHDSRVYYKTIKRTEASDIYKIDSYGIYKGDIFLILRCVNDNYELFSSNQIIANKYRMECINKNEYSVIVPKIEVEVFEEKTQLRD